MNPELLTCRRFTAGIVYPPQTIPPPELNKLYAEITERYPYQTLQHLPDGVRMANPEGDCFVQSNRTQVNENVMYFQASKEKCLDIFEIVQSRLKVPQFLNFGIKLTAFVPMQGENASAEFLESRVFALSREQWDLLGDGRRGEGFRVVLHQDGVHDLRIEPFYNDLTQLYVELDIQHPQPFAGLDPVGPKMDAAYEYLFGNVKDLLASMR